MKSATRSPEPPAGAAGRGGAGENVTKSTMPDGSLLWAGARGRKTHDSPPGPRPQGSRRGHRHGKQSGAAGGGEPGRLSPGPTPRGAERRNPHRNERREPTRSRREPAARPRAQKGPAVAQKGRPPKGRPRRHHGAKRRDEPRPPQHQRPRAPGAPNTPLYAAASDLVSQGSWSPVASAQADNDRSGRPLRSVGPARLESAQRPIRGGRGRARVAREPQRSSASTTAYVGGPRGRFRSRAPLLDIWTLFRHCSKGTWKNVH